MRMPMMQVWIVRMLVHHRRVPVTMRMRLGRRGVWPVGMLVMFIVEVPMLMHHLGVPVLMLMLFGDVQINAQRHQDARGDQAGCDRIAKHGDRQNRANERRRRKIGSGARGTKMAQSQHKQNQTETVTDKTDDAGTEHHGKSWKGAALCQREDEV